MLFLRISLLILPLSTILSAQEVPEDLVGDEHVREEFGVNRFTTPSIKKLFEQLDELGELTSLGLDTQGHRDDIEP